MGKSPFFMGKSPFLMGRSPFLIGKSQFLMGKYGVPGLVNIQKAMERSTMLLMGKSTISTGPWLQ